MVIIIFTIGIITFFFALEFSKAYERVKEIKDTPTTDIRYLEKGRFEIKADIDTESENIESPLSQIECVWYALIIKERVKRGKKRKWITRATSENFKKCILDDGTGKCEIDLSEINFDLGTQYQGGSGTFDDPTDQERNALQRVGIDPNTLFGFNRTFKYEEYILRQGDSLYILGNCEELYESKYEVLIKGTKDEPIFISDKSESELVRKYERRAGMFGGLILLCTSTAVYLLLFQPF